MKQVVVEAIEKATLSVFSMMVGLEVMKELGASPDDTVLQSGVPGVVSSFTLTGAISGTAKVTYSLDFAQFIAMQMLQLEEISQEEDVLDATGEIANMIIGNVKNDLESHVGSIQIGTPLVSRTAPSPTPRKIASSAAVRFRCSESVFVVAFAFQPLMD